MTRRKTSFSISLPNTTRKRNEGKWKRIWEYNRNAKDAQEAQTTRQGDAQGHVRWRKNKAKGTLLSDFRNLADHGR